MISSYNTICSKCLKYAKQLYTLYIHSLNHLVKIFSIIVLTWASQEAGLETVAYVFLPVRECNLSGQK